MTVFQHACVESGLELPVPEYRFHETRKWRFDWAFVSYRIALELEGGAWSRGRHVRGRGFVEDMSKYNEAQIAGWRVLRITPQQFNDGTGLELVMRAVENSKI